MCVSSLHDVYIRCNVTFGRLSMCTVMDEETPESPVLEVAKIFLDSGKNEGSWSTHLYL